MRAQRPQQMALGFLGCVVALAWLASSVRAEPPDSMSQGEASIAVRSDVKLGIKGTGGTTSERLTKLGQAVGDQMGGIRACYRKQVATSPEVVGALRVKIALDKGDKPELEVTQESGPTELVACMTRALAHGKYHDVGRPAAALLSLEFDNSRAKGQAQMVEKKTQLGHVEAQSASGGGQEATWSSDGGQLRISVRTEPAAPSGAVDLVMRAFQAGYAAFLDCRRKCEQGGVSPEGEIEAELNVDKQAHARTQLGTISVAHKRASGCADKAFKRLKFEPPAAPLSAHVTIHFAP